MTTVLFCSITSCEDRFPAKGNVIPRALFSCGSIAWKATISKDSLSTPSKPIPALRMGKILVNSIHTDCKISSKSREWLTVSAMRLISANSPARCSAASLAWRRISSALTRTEISLTMPLVPIAIPWSSRIGETTISLVNSTPSALR